MMVLRNIRNLLGNRAGTATIELAIALPVLSMMALGSIDLVLGFGHKLTLQQHAQSGADFMLANGEKAPTMAEVKAEVKDVSGLPDSAIQVQRWTECNQVKVAGFGLCPGVDDKKVSYMEITVTDAYTPIIQIEGVADFVQQQNLSGSVVVRLP